MVNRDFICVILFGFIKRRIIEGYDGGQKRDRIICLQRIDARGPKIYDHLEHRVPLWNVMMGDVRQ